MCLPLLDAMIPAISNASPFKPAAKAPLRMAVLYMPNGVNPFTWSPSGYGSKFELSETLSPLAGLKNDILVFSQLMNKQSIEGDGHYVKVAPFLTGTHITKTTGSDLRCGGVSLDQVIAQRIGNLTQLPSLELSVEPVTMGVDTNVGYTRLYGSHISWSSPTTPVTREMNPQQAFDRLFRPNAKATVFSQSDISVLDAVSKDAESLKNRVGSADKAKLDEYFESVRSVERRITFDAARRKGEYLGDDQARREVDKLGIRIKDYYQDPVKIANRGIDHTEQIRLMMDIIALAFWTDTTRVSTFMFGNEVSGKNFAFIPGVTGSHHEISHHQNEKAKLAEYQKINQWHIAQYAYLLDKLKSIKEGEGTLLDNSMIMFGAGIKDGNAHSPQNLPIILAGKGGGAFATGRHIQYEKNTALCGLYRGMLRAYNIPLSVFGDSEMELPGLSDPAYQGVTV